MSDHISLSHGVALLGQVRDCFGERLLAEFATRGPGETRVPDVVAAVERARASLDDVDPTTMEDLDMVAARMEPGTAFCAWRELLQRVLELETSTRESSDGSRHAKALAFRGGGGWGCFRPQPTWENPALLSSAVAAIVGPPLEAPLHLPSNHRMPLDNLLDALQAMLDGGIADADGPAQSPPLSPVTSVDEQFTAALRSRLEPIAEQLRSQDVADRIITLLGVGLTTQLTLHVGRYMFDIVDSETYVRSDVASSCRWDARYAAHLEHLLKTGKRVLFFTHEYGSYSRGASTMSISILSQDKTHITQLLFRRARATDASTPAPTFVAR